nr:MAG TPA: hypothetical protein [Bacteriophage sp.]
MICATKSLMRLLQTLFRWRMGGGTQTKLAHYVERSQRKGWTQQSGTIGSLTTVQIAVQKWIWRRDNERMENS